MGEIGRRTSAITGDRRETTFLFQRFSICIQRYNLVALKGTFPSTQEDEMSDRMTLTNTNNNNNNYYYYNYFTTDITIIILIFRIVIFIIIAIQSGISGFFFFDN